ncbi:MAG TPA: calcium-binding protein, partial [Tepidisphaeraceae bacterium]
MYEIHPLEQRCLLTANLQNGTLDITSSFFEDNYTITMDGTNITVVILAEGFNAQYPRTGPDRVQRINLHEPLEPANPQGLGSTITVTDPVSVGNHALGIPITIAASNHDDFISITGSGDASINGLDGADTIVGGEGNDTIQGGDGRTENNQQGVSEGDDILYGGAGDDQLFGQGGGGGGNMRIGDILMGQAGNDTLEGGAGRDLLDGGTGTNFISYADHTTDVELEFPSLAGAFNPANPLAFDNYPTQGIGTFNNQGQQEHDQIYNDLDTFGFGLGPYNPLEDWHTEFYTQSLANALGDGGFQGILGGNSNSPPGDDIIDVSLSTGISWTIFGNDGQDEILGSSQADSIDGGNQEDDIFGGGGADTIHGGAANDFIVGDDIANSTISNDQMFGDAGNDTVWGGLGNDTLDGGTGNDLLVGDIGGGNTDTNPGSGNDVLIGGDAATDGQGADTLQGDGGMDTADYTARTSPIKITFDTVHDDGAAGEGDFVTESTEIGLGGSGNDTLDGRFTSNVGRVLNGQGGNDTLVSGQGPDTIIGGTGTDSVDYRARTNPIVVTFDGLANDGDPLLNNGGPAGENDNVDNTVELVLTKDNPTGGGGNNGGGGGGGGGGATTAPLAPSALG